MADYVLDSGILIRHLRGAPGYAAMLKRLSEEGEVFIASFSRVEVIRGMREHERERTLALLDSLSLHALDRDTADLAGELMRAYGTRGIMLSGPDAVIAASAVRLAATLVTTNARHFPMPELSVLDAGPDGALHSVTR